MRKVVVSLAVLLGTACVLLGAVFVFREDLIRYGAGRFLPDGRLTLVKLRGVDVTSTELRVAELEFLLNESGQHLVIDGLDVDFRFTSVSSAPVVDSVSIESAQLLGAGDEGGDEAEEAESGAGTPLSETLTLLREFPLAHVAVGELRLPQRSQPVAVELQRQDDGLALTAGSGALRLDARFTQADPAATAQLEVLLRRGEVTVGDLDITLQATDDAYAVTGAGTLEFDDLNTLLGELDQSPLPVPLRSAHLELDISGALADDLGAYSDGVFPVVVLRLQPGSRLSLPAGLASELGEVALEFTGPAELTGLYAKGLVLNGGRLPVHATSRWREQPVDVNATLDLSDCAFTPGVECKLTFDGNASFGAYTLAGTLDLAADGSRYQVTTQGLSLGGLPELVPAFDISATIEVDGEAIAFSTPLLLRGTPTAGGIALDGTYDLATNSARMSVLLPELTFREEGAALSAWFPDWPYSFDVLTGTVTGELNLAWQAGAVTGSIQGAVKDVGGFYGDYFFRGVNGALQAEIDTAADPPLVIPPLTLTATGLDVGLPFEDLELQFSLARDGVLHVGSFVAKALGGSISGEDITYDFNRERNEVLVTFTGLRMERMLDLVDYEGIEAIGAVSGEVPLTITPNGVEVAEGVLAADAPGGSIRYLAAAAGATGNAGLDLVNQALGNYQFDSLTSDIDYKPDGELVLSMKLQGRNPDMSGGQRINLNLNLSDNIPALLESLQAAREIEDFLSEQYQ